MMRFSGAAGGSNVSRRPRMSGGSDGDPGRASVNRGPERRSRTGPEAKGNTYGHAGGGARTSAGCPSEGASGALTLEDRIGLLRAMLLMRGLEERAMRLYREGKVPGSFYDGYGQEAVSAGAAFAMAARGPAVHPAPGSRRAHHPRRHARSGSSRSTSAAPEASPAAATATSTSATAALGCVGMVSMLPDMMLVATGMAMAFKLRGERRCALTWFGDGSTSRGDFHEAMNWAGVQRLPVIFVLENNQYAYSTPVDKQFAVDPVERAAAYGFTGVTVDGNDAEAMFAATFAARRAGAGRRGSDADRGGDDADARPRRARRHALRAGRARRPVARAGSDRPPGRAADARPASTSSGCGRRWPAEIEAAAEAALASPMPDPATRARRRLLRAARPSRSATARPRTAGTAHERAS